MSEDEPGDWVQGHDDVIICGTDMKEHSRRPEGVMWCFRCRTRHEFWWVVMTPVDQFSYYGPSAHMAGVGPDCTDLFPGWVREAVEY